MKEITQLIRVMETLRKKVNSELPTQQAHILFMVADNPGITLPELARKLDMPQGSVSRNVKVLSTFIEPADAKKGKKNAEVKGLDLLRTEPDLINRKSLAVYLTRKGEVIMGQLIRTLNPPQRRKEAEAM